MHETMVTLVGRLATQLKRVRFDDGSLLVSGRMACTGRRFDRATEQWIDGKTLFMGVVCRRALAENAFSSLRSGDPVIAHGRLHTREFEKDGVRRTVTELEAWSIGPDLQWCTTVLTRKPRTSSPTGPGGVPLPTGVPSGETTWVAGGDADDGIDDRFDPGDIPSDDPWVDHVTLEGPTGEVAVGV